MTNIWLQRNKNKKYTFEIAKNAIFRIGPTQVKIVDKNDKGCRVVLNMGDAGNVDVVGLANIMDEIRHKKDRSYYGRLRTYRNKKESNVVEMEVITSLEINFDHTDLLLTVYYV